MAKDNAESRGLGVVYLLAGMAVFGSATPVSKLVGQDFPVFTASFLRVMLGALALAPFVAPGLRGNLARMTRRDWIYVGLVAVFGMVGFTVFLIYGMKFISGVAGSLIMSFTPALTALAAVVFLRSPLNGAKLAAIALGVAGVVLINVFRGQFDDQQSSHFYLGVVLVLLAISCEACYTLIGKKATETLPPVFASFLACIVSLPAFALLALLDIRQAMNADISPGSWVALLWWGVGTLAAGSALWYSGVARAEGTAAAGFMAVMPASALILSYGLLGETFQPLHAAGIGLVMASVGLMSWVHMRSGAETPVRTRPCKPCQG